MPTQRLHDLLSIEVGGQIEYYEANKKYLVNQKLFMIEKLQELGYFVYNTGVVDSHKNVA